MSNLVTEIVPSLHNVEVQPEPKLKPIGDFFICADFSEDIKRRPSTLEIKGHLYYRFMHYIYLPQPPQDLDLTRVIDLCDLRLKYMDNLVDSELNKCVVDAIANCASAEVIKAKNSGYPIKALDFGCGDGLSSRLLLQHFPDMELKGVDISSKAIERARQSNLDALLCYDGKGIPFETAAFDLVFAIFVLHFNIATETLKELRRVLKPSGKFIFNVYFRDIKSIVQQLEEAGFCSIKSWKALPEADTNHLIVSCMPGEVTARTDV